MLNKFGYFAKLGNVSTVEPTMRYHSAAHTDPCTLRQALAHIRGCVLVYQRRADHASPLSFGAKSESDTTYISRELHPPLSSTKLPLHKVTLELMGRSIKQPVLPIICPKSVKYVLNPNCTWSRQNIFSPPEGGWKSQEAAFDLTTAC